MKIRRTRMTIETTLQSLTQGVQGKLQRRWRGPGKEGGENPVCVYKRHLSYDVESQLKLVVSELIGEYNVAWGLYLPFGHAVEFKDRLKDVDTVPEWLCHSPSTSGAQSATNGTRQACNISRICMTSLLRCDVDLRGKSTSSRPLCHVRWRYEMHNWSQIDNSFPSP